MLFYSPCSIVILDIDFSETCHDKMCCNTSLWQYDTIDNEIDIKYNYSQISALKLLNVPMLVSEQNPTSLGKTIPELDISGAKGPFAKTQFSMCTPEVSICVCCILYKIILYNNTNVII